MPKLPILKPKDVIKRFQKLGFVKDRQTGSHVIMYHPLTKQRANIPLHVRDLAKGTLKAILNQTGISVEKFINAK